MKKGTRSKCHRARCGRLNVIVGACTLFVDTNAVLRRSTIDAAAHITSHHSIGPNH